MNRVITVNEPSHSATGQCPECEKHSDLHLLVAELLYRNQVLRFELIEALTQVERFAVAAPAGYDIGYTS